MKGTLTSGSTVSGATINGGTIVGGQYLTSTNATVKRLGIQPSALDRLIWISTGHAKELEAAILDVGSVSVTGWTTPRPYITIAPPMTEDTGNNAWNEPLSKLALYAGSRGEYGVQGYTGPTPALMDWPGDFNVGAVSAQSVVVSGGMDVTGVFNTDSNLTAPAAILDASVSIKGPTSGSYTANVNWNSSNGYLRVISSSAKHKENIRDAVIDVDKVLSLRVRTFQRNDEEDADGNFIGYRPDNPWYVGHIAQEAEALGLTDWVEYGPDGEPRSFAYANWGVALQAVAQQHHSRIAALEGEVAELRALLAGRMN